eukprot:TRINITY_DN3812_c0_g1_i1.p1 TRINITY_DN3812_c0_g1~~TRINITY_DN3812_c0_g1_i1.p1  ORF type:complete len:120 (-),score=24.77 TRINITY_DN3812_c0_g1_i1:221-580(-)
MPCGQFLNQEPGRNSEILNCIRYVRPGAGFIPSYQLFEKTLVNGDNRHPVYDYLTNVCPPTQTCILPLQYITWSPVQISDITWNFEKFLLDKNGFPYKRYNPSTDPIFLRDDINYLISQ